MRGGIDRRDFLGAAAMTMTAAKVGASATNASAMGLADGERRYDEIEQQLAAAPTIRVPTITMEGDANGAPHPPPEAYRSKFVGKYEHRTIGGGLGHDLPQEAPREFAKAIVDVAKT